MTQTPFEIRFNLLHYAKDQLTNEYNAAIDRIHIQKNYGLEIEKMPSFPTKDEIVKLADELKQFVDNK